jgi:hypothetical protein
MKSFKEIVKETTLNEGGEMYPADEMTMKELKIACYAAQNILDRLEDGAMVQRWQISAIVKAKEELASVYTSMSADEDDEEWDDEEDDDTMYVGFEYPSMYGEEVELDEDIKGTFKNFKKHAANLGDKFVQGALHGATFGMMGHDTHDPLTGDTYNKVKPFSNRSKKKKIKEELDFKVSVDGLPDMYVKGNSPAEVKTNLRKVIKKPDSIQSVDRVTQAMLKKIFRDKAMGKDEIEEETDINEETKDLYVVKGKSPFYKQDHYLDTHSDPRAHVIKKHVKHATRMSRDEAQKHAKDWEKSGNVNKYKAEVVKVNEEVEQIDEVEGSAKRNRELHAAGRISKDEFNKRMGYGKYKKKGPAGVGPLGNSLYKNLVKSAVAKNEELEEGYSDPEYIRRAIPALKNAVEFHKDTMKDHDKKSVKGSAEYVRAHSAAANAHKEAAERHRIAHAQLSAGSKDVEYYVKPARELGAYAEKLSDKANKLKEETELDEALHYLKKSYRAKGAPAEWAVIPKGSVKPVEVFKTQEEAERYIRKKEAKQPK